APSAKPNASMSSSSARCRSTSPSAKHPTAAILLSWPIQRASTRKSSAASPGDWWRSSAVRRYGKRRGSSSRSGDAKRGEAAERYLRCLERDSNLFLAQLIGDVVGLADRQRHDREGWVLRAAGRELAAIGDEEILDVVGLAPLVDDAVAWILRHAIGAEI